MIEKLSIIHRKLTEAICSPEMPPIGHAEVKRPLIEAIELLEELLIFERKKEKL